MSYTKDDTPPDDNNIYGVSQHLNEYLVCEGYDLYWTYNSNASQAQVYCYGTIHAVTHEEEASYNLTIEDFQQITPEIMLLLATAFIGRQIIGLFRKSTD